jgi:hypothetical protein
VDRLPDFPDPYIPVKGNLQRRISGDLQCDLLGGIWCLDGFSGKAESCAAMAVHIAKNRKMKRCDFIADLGRWATVRFGVGKFIGKWGPRKGGSEYLPILRTDHLAIPLEM